MYVEGEKINTHTDTREEFHAKEGGEFNY